MNMTAPVDPNALSYEEAARELEELIAVLEAPQTSLEDTLALYERGQLLAKRCSDLLSQAEIRLRQLGGEEA
jgi:exodeoxyribonuclease VII small subunit